MSSKSKYIDFSGTPLASASANAHLLASNLYFSLLLRETIDAQLEMEKDYEILLLKDGDPVDIEEKRRQIDYADNLLGLNILYTIGEDLDS